MSRAVKPEAKRAAPAPAPADAAQVFLIGCGKADEGNGEVSPQKMGFKAFNLLRMATLGLTVPPAFVLGTRYCTAYADDSAQSARTHGELSAAWPAALSRVEEATGLRFGDARRPLLLSVRSGAPVSMPGMMETLLNVGLTDRTLNGFIGLTGNPRLAWDAYRRLVATYGEVVAGVPAAAFEEELTRVATGRDERELDFAQLRDLARSFLAVYRESAGLPFPQDAGEQLQQSIDAVFRSWMSQRACDYRRVNHIDDRVGTAVTAQAMVFGNAGGMSGAGVGFSRDPVSGDSALWVDFLFNGQGEDVVSGRRSAHGHDVLAGTLPHVWEELSKAAGALERSFGDMQDFEFTVQEGRLYMLQTRSGKRAPRAAARIALDLLEEGVISRDEARIRVSGLNEDTLVISRVVAGDGKALSPLAAAASANGGVASGEIALDETRARDRHAAGVAVILVRRDAETADMGAMEAASGLLTEHGARTSHAAVVARQLGKVCLVGCEKLKIDEAARRVRLGDLELAEGSIITLDGNEGLIYQGATRVELDRPGGLLKRLAALR
ncbi:MAG: PEP/pyruvate-binding domain-containing protein [Betaproteobacteria bacterium]